MPVSDPDVSRPRLIRDATFLEADRRERFAALQLGADAETIHAYARRQQTVSEHQQRIGEYLRLRTWDTAAGERLARFLEDEALRLERTASLLARARVWLRDEHVLAPSDSVLRRAIGAARNKARDTVLTERMAERLSAPMRDRLDALVAVDGDQPHSPLNRIKASSSNPSVGGMKRSCRPRRRSSGCAPTRWSTANAGKPVLPSGFRPGSGVNWSTCSTKRSTPA